MADGNKVDDTGTGVTGTDTDKSGDNIPALSSGVKYHSESDLFLRDFYENLVEEAPEVYDVDREFEKTSRNKGRFTLVLIASVIAVISVLLFLSTYMINRSLRNVHIDISTFNDLNFQNLLNRAARVEASYNSAVTEKAILESKTAFEIRNINFERDAAVTTIRNMGLAKNEERERIKNEYAKAARREADMKSEAEQKLDELDAKIAEYKKELEEFDKMNLEASQSVNAERRRFETEKEELKKRYDSIIDDLKAQIEEMQKLESVTRSGNIAAIAAEYQKKLDAAEAEIALAEEKIASLEANLRAISAQADTAKKTSQRLQSELEFEKTLGGSYRSNLQYQAEEQGYAGVVVDASDISNILLYIDPLYGGELEGQRAFIYRQNFEHIADIVIYGKDGVFRGRLVSLDDGKEIKSNDRISINTRGDNE